jgi:hypothetical protein
MDGFSGLGVPQNPIIGAALLNPEDPLAPIGSVTWSLIEPEPNAMKKDMPS